jgi:hypothetical protein
MSWTRVHDDADTVSADALQSQNVLHHQFGAQVVQTPPSCFTSQVGYETQSVQRYPYSQTRVNAESELYGLSRKLSKAPEQQYPFHQDTPAIAAEQMCGPEQMLLTEHTRFAMPLYRREQSTLRFDPLHHNPQQLEAIHPTYYNGTNTRQLEKDSYRLIKPTVKDQTNLWQKEGFCGCGM